MKNGAATCATPVKQPDPAEITGEASLLLLLLLLLLLIAQLPHLPLFHLIPPPHPTPPTSSKPQKFNNELRSCAKTQDGEKKKRRRRKVSSLEALSSFCSNPAVGILSAQSSHRHLNLPRLHPIPVVPLFKSLPPPGPPHF